MAANNTLIISGIKSSDLIIGQHITFIVTLSSSENIVIKKKVTIKEGHSENIKFDHDSVDLSYEPGNHTATATFGFKILPNAINNPNISFEVDTNATAGGVNFHSKSFSDKAKTAIVDIKKPMDISINKNADLVIGQHVSFTVTLSSDKPISLAANITISNKTPNIQFDQPSANLGYDSTFKHASAKLGFTVLEGTTDNSEIKFNVDTTATSGGVAFSSVLFQGTANEIDKNSLSLSILNPFLKTVLPETGPVSETNNSTPITATLKSISGKLLTYTPVFITSTVLHKMNDFKFKQADKQTDITPEKIGHNEGLILTSDKKGEVKFYLYPKLSEIEILTLRTIILNDVADVPAKQIIYVVNYKDPGYMDSIGYPTIDGFTIGNLSSPGMKDFSTTVSSYDQKDITDRILFFVNGDYTGHSVSAEQINNPIYLPYSIFKENESSQFSYIAVKTGGDVLYSEVLTLNYIGGTPYEPDPGVKRKFNPCIVHTSLGVGPDNILQPGLGNYINYGAIMKYPGYTHRGIFIEIARSDSKFINLPEGTKAVPLDISDITLTMYINSDGNSFQKPYAQQIKLADIGGPEPDNKNSIFFHVPYDDIVNIHGNGYVYFDYQFYQGDKLEYGAIWNSSIETIPVPGE
ncbi:hypothetical protein [Xenorhabdus sp. KK7.4]|uniref:hypothetical protein n=1 Tax=Xenorhabdus sp. KK7.4 TaxID=1851572 RepID=UPI000C04C4F6|nr:hypothetical protein [Xenorhabdus sp. KK7.4]PHM53940.1 hypothetical protein Xekk_02693 [Xenorhabdus sp. KK7.4]